MKDERTEAEIIAEAYSDDARANWKAPVQVGRGGRMYIPWDIHLEAYEAYCKKWSHQTALIDLKGRGCRGGFSTEELDGFVPGWRDRVTAIGKMQARLAELEAAASAPPTGIAALPTASITKLIIAFSKLADFTANDDMAIHEALLDAQRKAKGTVQ